MTLQEIEEILFQEKEIHLSSEEQKKILDSHLFLNDFAKDKVIYGINTGFGPMAQYRIQDEALNDLQYNIIRSHSTGAGEPFAPIYVRAAMMARLATFVRGQSGLNPDVTQMLTTFINKHIYPLVPQHGSVGASGDLVQLAHIALTLIGEGKVHYKGVWRPTIEVLNENNLKPIQVYIREGLSLTNGTSVMTGISVINQYNAENLLDWATLGSVLLNEIASSYDDFMAEELNWCRRHTGQHVIARRMREISSGSQCMRNRAASLYDGGHSEKTSFTHKVQAYYSLRCIPQIYGPIYDTLSNTREILEDEMSSACDNPIVDKDAGNVFHGGNFHGDYISLEEDKVKISLVRLVMTLERQLNYLFHDKINGILPPFLNLGVLGLNYGMQACQFTATSTTAECQTLAMPNYVHSIPNNNDNQDIVSMGTNTALLCKKVIENAYQVMSIYYIALVQAVDCLKIKDKLAPLTRKVYDEIRGIVPLFIEDTPFDEDIAVIEKYLKKNRLYLK